LLAAVSDGKRGPLLSIRVTPGAKEDRIEVSEAGDIVSVRTSSEARDGEANEDVARQLADALRAPKSAVAVVTGHRSRDKTVKVEGLSAEVLSARLASIRGVGTA